MKKILLLPVLALFLSCGQSADFKTLKITSQINDEPIVEKVIEGNFTKTKADEMGLIEITDSEKRVKISYYDETPLKMLNVKFGDNTPTEWRTNKGHDLFLNQTTDSLGIIFGDRNSVAGKVKGSILFIK